MARRRSSRRRSSHRGGGFGLGNIVKTLAFAIGGAAVASAANVDSRIGAAVGGYVGGGVKGAVIGAGVEHFTGVGQKAKGALMGIATQSGIGGASATGGTALHLYG